MISITFTESDVRQLREERFHHPHPRVQRKAETLLLKSRGLKHKEICEIAGICGSTLRSYIRDYEAGGVERLKELNFRINKSDLEQHRHLIEEYFEKHPPAGMKEATAAAEKLTGIRRGENRVREYLKSIGMKRRKVGMIPAKADPDRQEVFPKEELKPRLKEAEEGERAVFF